ncbi:MAG: choice-of-anchor H family protein [Pseudomonadota bacterium]
MRTQSTFGLGRPLLRYAFDLGAVAAGVLVAFFSLSAQGQSLPTSDSVNVTERIATSRGVPSSANSVTGRLAPPATVTQKPRSDASTDKKRSVYGDFDIYDADVTLYFDDDLDGHYYGIDVNFDADTDYVTADVYAMLYFSLEGGPWELYYTTEIFTLFNDSGNDDYTVETELYSGYPTAYYDVLIELYDADTGDFVADFGPSDSPELDDAPLEDQQKDIGIITLGPEPIVSHSHGGGGSLSQLSLFMLLLSVALIRRTRQPLLAAG